MPTDEPSSQHTRLQRAIAGAVDQAQRDLITWTLGALQTVGPARLVAILSSLDKPYSPGEIALVLKRLAIVGGPEPPPRS